MKEHQPKYDPERLKKAHRLMEWSNIIVIACAALGATAWFTSHLVLFYVLGSIALILTLLFMWGPVIVGIAGPGEGGPARAAFSVLTHPAIPWTMHLHEHNC